MNNMRKRVEYVDQIKGILIIFMVLFHINFTGRNAVFTNIINSFFNLGVFFVVAGFFLNDEIASTPSIFFKKKIKSLYKPAMYICIPILLLHNYFLNIGWYSTNVNYAGKSLYYFTWNQYLINFAKTLFLGCREPLIGAMWFVFCLLISLILYMIITYIIKRIGFNELNTYRLCIIFLLQVISCILTEKYNINIPRFSNALSVCFLIFIGHIIYTKCNNILNNKYIFVVSIIIIIYNIFQNGYCIYNANRYSNLYYLDTTCIASLCFMSYFLQNIKIPILTWVTKYCGQKSFYIMGLHMIGFRVCTDCLLAANFCMPKDNLAALEPSTSNLFIDLLYLLSGIIIPILIVNCSSFLSNRIKIQYKKYVNINDNKAN